MAQDTLGFNEAAINRSRKVPVSEANAARLRLLQLLIAASLKPSVSCAIARFSCLCFPRSVDRGLIEAGGAGRRWPR